MSPIIYNRATQHIIDLAILAVSFLLGYLLRFEGIPAGLDYKQMVFQLPYVVILGIGAYYITGVYRYIWRYISLREVKGFGYAHLLVSSVLLLARYGLPSGYHYGKVPVSVVVINAFLAFIGSVGVRAVHRLVVERSERLRREEQMPTSRRQRVLLIGAGSAGNLAARELHGRTDMGMDPIGFVDDDPIKQGREVQGLKVLGTADIIPSVVGLHKVDMLLITVASITGPQMRRIKEICDRTRLPVKILPGLYELIDGSVSVSRIRDVDIEDLLGRAAVHLDEQSISGFLKGKVVLVSGAGGSIGSEMCRQICRFEPKRLLLLEQAETPLFDIHRELLAKKFPFDVVPLIADICDSGRLKNVFTEFRPQVVIHSAAHKHVPMMEWNPGEAVKNNVFGTKKLADVSVESGVERFIMISTDKAVNPTSIMGATKRIAEMYLQSLNSAGSQKSEVGNQKADSGSSHTDLRPPTSGLRGSTRFIAVRFGNVLGSAGSVIPIFKEQIKKGGPLTITHPEMTRYFMTIPEASQLVLQAAAMGQGGEVFVLDMGEPVKIIDLAKDLIRLSGLHEDEIDIVFTGLRPGEKLFEEICLTCEEFNKTLHPKIFTGRLAPVEPEAIGRSLERMHELTDGKDRGAVAAAVKAVVPEYTGAMEES